MLSVIVGYNDIVDTYDLTAMDQNQMVLVRVEGLNPPPMTVNTSASGNIDGTFFNSTRAEQRNIVLTILPRGRNIETNRQLLYQIFPLRKEIVLRFKNKNRDVTISGYVESIEGSLFDNPQTFTVSIICPQPYFKSFLPNTQNIYPVASDAFNAGGFETGMEIDIDIDETMTGTAVQGLKILNRSLNTFIGFTAGFTRGSHIHISTFRGNLSADATINIVPYHLNLLRYLTDGSSWIKLRAGQNSLSFETSNDTSNYVTATIKWYDLYAGV